MSRLFSVIIPNYNREKRIARTLESLVAQTFKNFEVIICDDGSTDSSVNEIQKFNNDLDLKLIETENWGGPARPRNLAVQQAVGEWLCFLDSDDWWDSNKLEVLSHNLTESDVIFHRLLIQDSSYESNRITPTPPTLEGDIFIKLMTEGNFLCNSGTSIRKSTFEKIGKLAEEKSLIAVEDYDLWIRAALHQARFKYLPQVLGYYWLEDGENISEFNLKQVERNKAVIDRHIHQLKDLDQQKQANALISYIEGKAYLQQGNSTAARASFSKAISAKKMRIKLISLIRVLMLSIKP